MRRSKRVALGIGRSNNNKVDKAELESILQGIIKLKLKLKLNVGKELLRGRGEGGRGGDEIEGNVCADVRGLVGSMSKNARGILTRNPQKSGRP